jgi:hypothetical protein
MSIDFFRKIIREVVSTDFSNDGQGGIESQTGSDLMGYWHGEGGAIHQGSQPAENGSEHIYFNSGGGKDQSQDQTDSASESGAKEQVATGIEESEDDIKKDSLIDYVLEYQKAAKDMKSSNFILKKIHKMSEGANGGKVSFKIKSGKYESKPIELLVDLYLRTQFSNPIDIHTFSKEDKRKGIEISIFLNGDFVEKVEDAMSFVRNLYHY